MFVKYCVYGESSSSLLMESTNSMIGKAKFSSEFGVINSMRL